MTYHLLLNFSIQYKVNKAASAIPSLLFTFQRSEFPNFNLARSKLSFLDDPNPKDFFQIEGAT